MDPEIFAVVKGAVEDTDRAHAERFLQSRRATASLRALIELMRERAISEADYSRLADGIDTLIGGVERAGLSPRFDDTPMSVGDAQWRARFEYGLNGRSTVARPEFSYVLGDGTVTGTVTFGSANEGTVAGVATGPWIAYVLDLALVGAGGSNGGVVTRELTIGYRRPVPTRTPLTVRAQLDHTDGRTMTMSGQISRDDEVLIEARASSVDPTAPRPPAT
jgi:acyl-coenzyme A thioesterase PaaI-like protein